MTALMTGLYNKLKTTNTLNTALGTRFYHTLAPEGTSYPCMTYSIVSATQNDTFDKYIENVLLQFNLYSILASPIESHTNYGYLTTLLDYASLTVAGYSHIYCIREWSQLLKLDEYWQYAVQYRTEIQKS